MMGERESNVTAETENVESWFEEGNEGILPSIPLQRQTSIAVLVAKDVDRKSSVQVLLESLAIYERT